MNTNQNRFDLTAINPAYHVLMSQAIRQTEGYTLVPLGIYNGQTAFIEGRTNTLYIGSNPSTARKLELSGLEQLTEGVN